VGREAYFEKIFTFAARSCPFFTTVNWERIAVFVSGPVTASFPGTPWGLRRSQGQRAVRVRRSRSLVFLCSTSPLSEQR
jgi:hypothetical protein